MQMGLMVQGRRQREQISTYEAISTDIGKTPLARSLQFIPIPLPISPGNYKVTQIGKDKLLFSLFIF